MEVFQDLYIAADHPTMATVVEELESRLPAGWRRDREAEKIVGAQREIHQPGPTYCFSCTKSGRRPAATLVLGQKDAGTFYVSNIVPAKLGRLTHGQYNAILGEFYREAFAPLAEKHHLEHTLTAPNVGIEEWLSPDTAELLHRFSAGANKGSAAAHPSDRDRWLSFVVAAHNEDSTLNATTLRRWLVEAEEWPEEVAHQLASDYENAREVLRFAAAHNGI